MTETRERLRGVLRPGGYDPGDKVTALVKGIDGVERRCEFRVESYCGGGFAGQVYRARLLVSQDDWLPPGSYGLKFYSTRSGLRRRFRDALYFLGFQSPFPHQYKESALRAGMFVTKLLRLVSRDVFGDESHISDCHGTFWDEHVGTFAEVNEWVEGRVSDPDIDPGILLRYFHNRRPSRARSVGDNDRPMLESHSQVAAKRSFMRSWVRLCAELGVDDLARQVYWWTGMSQPNVLTRDSDEESPQFVWVDRKPGLPGFLLSLGDFPLLARAVMRGSVPPFDRIDFRKLKAWAKSPEPETWRALAEKLRAEDDVYRRSQVDVIGHNLRLLTDRGLRKDIARSIVDYWRRTGRLDAAAAGRVGNSGLRIALHVLINCVPLVGRRAHRLLGNSEYRAHVRRIICERGYRFDYFDSRRKVDLAMWLRDERVTESRAGKCLDSLPAYFRDLLCFSWIPASWQRFFTDWGQARDSLRRLFTSPLKYIFVLPYRRKVNLDWVHERTEEDVRNGYVSREEADVFTSVAGSETMQKYVTGIMVTLALQPASELVFLALAAILGIKGLSDFEGLKHSIRGLGWWAVPLGVAFVAVSPAGILRFVYCVVQWVRDRHVPYGTALSLALFRAIGDLAFIVQTARTYPQFSGYLLTSSLCHLVGIVPVFGERGGLLNIWAATVLLSWPASFRAWRHERKVGVGS